MNVNEVFSSLTRPKFDIILKKEQVDMIQSICDKHHTFGILPTGFGKSLSYILPPVLLDHYDHSKRHYALVISPLNALIRRTSVLHWHLSGYKLFI